MHIHERLEREVAFDVAAFDQLDKDAAADQNGK